MKAGVKRKSSSPEPAHAKVVKREPCSYPATELTFSPMKMKISTPNKRKPQNSSSPRRQSPRFKCNGKRAGCFGHDAAQFFSSPESSPFQPEVDTELGLVITLDDENGEEAEQVRWKSEVKVKKEHRLTNYNRTRPDKDRAAEESSQEEDSEEEFRKLDRDLAVKSKQHNLTSVHVRNIIHEVITNEHVVAMMKAAIRETQDMPMFEPKMTRSKLKEVVERGVGIPNWSISPINKPKEIKLPQFVDIPLEDEEDSSDEEYYPDEDEEDETAEETILESDMDSIASSPRISNRGRPCTPIGFSDCEEEKGKSSQTKTKWQRHLRVEAVPMGPPAPPSQSSGGSRLPRAIDSFMEKLHAVDEELALNCLCIEPYQAISSGEGAEESLVACRTRSKRPLRDIPLDQLEAELKAPDITPDMYDNSSALEDKEWSHWLQGLMTSHLDNDEEGDDDDDDPEYNFLDDLDEPDLEDYRNDRAVRITRKEVTELMEELFETFQDEIGANEDEEGHEGDGDQEEEVSSQCPAKFNVPQAIRFEEPLAHMLTACRRTVRDQLDALHQRRHQQSQSNHNVQGPNMLLIPNTCTLVVTPTQKWRLQQQIQQHVQLLTQVNMLCSTVEALQSQASTTALFLMELQSFAERAEQSKALTEPGFRSAFSVCNLQPSLNVLRELEKTPSSPTPLPRCKQSHTVHPYPLLPAHLAWLFATRSVFLYPELLPHCSLDPALQPPRKNIYTKGDDGLIVLGLKHFRETEFPYHLMSQYLVLPKRVEQLRARVKDMSSSRATDNVIKFYCQNHIVPPLPVACCPVMPGEERPPVEREKDKMPNWLQKSLSYIHKAVFSSQSEERTLSDSAASPPLIFPKTQYPRALPEGLTLQLHPSARRPCSNRPSKPRPLHGFARTPSTPLAKAPVCPTDTVNLVPKIPAPLPSQGVIVLSHGPFVPVNEALPATQVTATPAHGSVPLNNAGPINFQYVVPQLGCVNPVGHVASLPPAVVQVGSTPAHSVTVPTNDVVASCVTYAVLKKAEVPRKNFMHRKLLPIQPTLNPIQLVPPTPVSLVKAALSAEQLRAANFVENVSNTAAPMVIIQASSLLDSAIHSQVATHTLVTSTHPQDSPYLETLARPLFPNTSVGISGQDTQKKNSEFTMNSNPVFLPRTPPPPLQIFESLKSSPDFQNKNHQKHTGLEVKRDLPVSSHQNFRPVENGQSTTPLNPGSLASGSIGTALALPTTSRHSHSPLTEPSVSNSQYVLIQAASQLGTQQYLIVPQNSLIKQEPVSHAAGVSEQKNTLHKSEAFHTSDLPNGNKDNSSLRNVELPSKVAESQKASPSSTEMGECELCKEEVEAGVEVDEEEMASALFGSPVLAISDSSSSLNSILSSSSCMDSSTEAFDNMIDDIKDNTKNDEQRGEVEQLKIHSSKADNKSGSDSIYASLTPARRVKQVSTQCDKHDIPGLLTLTSGDENQEPPGEGERNGGGGGDGESHENGERRGGEARDVNGGEKGGDGEGNGGRDGQRESEGSGGRDRNDEDKEGDGEREEEEEDFDELTQDEDEEEVMSSASEESVLSVPELQETMEKLTWLASERRLCGEGDSEEDNSPNSPASPTSPISQNSQEENSEDEEDGVMKHEELEPPEGEGEKLPEGNVPQEGDPPQTKGKGVGRGRGRGRRPPRSLRKSRRQERCSKDTSKLLLLYDDRILENDPMRESKDIAFAQAYLNRVREALQDTPSKVEEFLGLLYEFEQGGESQSVVELFCQLKHLLKEWPELLRDFAAFLLPEQALECGLFAEQQAFERSRRFLRQLEISFGENPSHYQKIVKALQSASSLTPAGIDELKAQMATLLKGHTHLQGEFSIFFDDIRPPPTRPGEFEEAVWPEDGASTPEAGDGASSAGGGGLSGGFEEVTLPDLDEEEEISKLPQITGKRKKRNELCPHRSYKDCDWPEKDCSCHCHLSSHEAKHRRHKKKGCSSCHGIKGTDGSKSLKSGDRPFSTTDLSPDRVGERDETGKGGEEKEAQREGETEVKDEFGNGTNSPHQEPDGLPWEGCEGEPPVIPEERDEDEEEEDEEEWEEGEKRRSSITSKSSREDDVQSAGHSQASTVFTSGEKETAHQSRQNLSAETPVCAKNISLTPSGERVVLWTREADRVILTACQQQGANPSTFQSISIQLGNKTASEVSKRFRDLMRLFHTSAHQVSSEDEATEQQSATDDEQD